MGTKATGTFTMSKWDENVAIDLAGDAKVTHARIVQELDGDFRATGTAQLLMHYRDADTATIVGFQHFDGSLDGREGTFLAEFNGTYDGATATARLTVVPGSATGALEGLRGDGSTVAGHEPPGDYDFEFTTE